jgi:regulator of nonsense transcripts 2
LLTLLSFIQLTNKHSTGLELNGRAAAGQQQRRLAAVEFLGELFAHRLVTETVVFDTLYLLITLGHGVNEATGAVEAASDPPADGFRARLVCRLLASVGGFCARGAMARRLDTFL